MEGNEDEEINDEHKVLIQKITIKTPNKAKNKVEVINEDYISK